MAIKRKKPFWVRTLNSKFFLVGEVIIVILIFVALGKETFHRYEVNKKINSLKNEISTLETKHNELNDFIVYLDSPSFQEREARLKLGLQKEGESVIIIPEEESLQNVASSQEGEVEGANDIREISNPTNWWNYFFQ